MKKAQPFHWTTECWEALDTLIKAVTDGPTLSQPDLAHPFYLQVDVSAYATGAVLTAGRQEETPCHQVLLQNIQQR